MTTIVLADDHHIVRQSLRTLLDAEYDLTVVGEAADGFAATNLVERLVPDVLIVDLMMPGVSGLEVTRQVHQRVPHTKVIILSMQTSEAYVLEALHNGAVAYVVKDAQAADLVRAVHEVIAGRRYLSPPLSERAIEAYLARVAESKPDPYDVLTTREREVLHLAANGYSNREIGHQLSISSRTAEIHRANLMRKLNLHTQTDLIRYAIRRRVIPMGD